MTNTAHKNLTGTDLHEPKGIGSATSGQIYVANGSGSGTWTTPTTAGCIKIVTKTASASSTLDFFNGSGGVVFDSTYRAYFFDLQNLVPATDDTGFQAQVGTGAGPTYQTTSYYVDSSGAAGAGAVSNPVGASNTSAFLLAVNAGGNGIDNTATYGGLSGGITFRNVTGTTGYPHATYQTTYPYSSTGHFHVNGSGMYAATGAITAVRFKMSSGNITSGSITLYGYL